MKRLIILTLISLMAVFAANAQDKHQCTGKTKAGVQCKNKTESTYCKMHDPATPRCGADKKSGGKCQRIVKVAGARCFDHK